MQPDKESVRTRRDETVVEDVSASAHERLGATSRYEETGQLNSRTLWFIRDFVWTWFSVVARQPNFVGLLHWTEPSGSFARLLSRKLCMLADS